MSEIGSYLAKPQLSKLLSRVKKGERFTITVHGHPVAELVPIAPPAADRARAALLKIDAVRTRLRKEGIATKKILKKGETLRDLVHSEHRI